MKRFRLQLACLGLCAGLHAHAADPVTDAITLAYAPYRAALFQTSMKGQSESEQAIAQARQAWQVIMDRFAAKPTIPYDADKAFGTTLGDVARVYEQAAREIQDKKLSQAHETLEKARDLLAELRRRNGVIVFSDHMNAYHAAMEHLLEGDKDLTNSPQGMLTLVERVGVLSYLAGQLGSEAPKSLLDNPDFAAALQAVKASVTELRQAALKQDLAAAREALGKLKRPYSRLFMKFG